MHGQTIANTAGNAKDFEMDRRNKLSCALVIASAVRNLLHGKMKRQHEGCLSPECWTSTVLKPG
jgi:hypothetical protein